MTGPACFFWRPASALTAAAGCLFAAWLYVIRSDETSDTRRHAGQSASLDPEPAEGRVDELRHDRVLSRHSAASVPWPVSVGLVLGRLVSSAFIDLDKPLSAGEPSRARVQHVICGEEDEHQRL